MTGGRLAKKKKKKASLSQEAGEHHPHFPGCDELEPHWSWWGLSQSCVFMLEWALSSRVGITEATWHQLFISQQLADGGVGLEEQRVVLEKESEAFSGYVSPSVSSHSRSSARHYREFSSRGFNLPAENWQLVFTLVCWLWRRPQWWTTWLRPKREAKV